MQKSFFSKNRLFTLAVGVAYLGIQGLAYGQDDPRLPPKDRPRMQGIDWQKHEQMHTEMMLNSIANRLEIKASQQIQWGEFALAFKALHSMHNMQNSLPVDRPEMDKFKLPGQMDAATLAKLMAEKMTDQAAKMTILASKTEQLQKVLTPEQQTTLNQFAIQALSHRRYMRGEPLGPIPH